MIRIDPLNRARQLRPHSTAIAATIALFLLVSIAPTALAQTPCARVTVTADQPTSLIFIDDFETGNLAGWDEPFPAFRATEILDVIFEVELDGELQELQVLTLEVKDPNGHLFRELTVPVTTESGRRDKNVRLDGFPHPVRLAVVEKVEGRAMIEVRFPVAGTSIVSSSVYGSWHVAPLIDGKPSWCEAESRRFFLVP